MRSLGFACAPKNDRMNAKSKTERKMSSPTVSPRQIYRVHALFSPFVHTLNTFVHNGVEKPIFDGPLLKMSSSRFQLNAPFSQNTGVHTRIFENAAIFISVVVVLRPRAITRALTACTCADVIQPCSLCRGSLPDFKPWRSRYESVNYGISHYWFT